MQRSILAVSPNLQFLEQIRSHLEEGGRYRVQGVTSGVDALALVRNTYYDLAILDAESSDVPFVPFTRDLVATQPGLKLLVFPPQNNPHHPVLTGLVTNGFLNKPFFTPEVSRALKNIFQEPVEEPEPELDLTNDLAKLWMQRPEMGIKRVEQLLGSTTAQTGLLVSQGKVIAGSGPCDDTTIQMALNLLDLHRNGKESLELIRFIPLESEGGELLIYASQLINDVTLVLFYPPTSSIQLVRQEVYQVKEEFKQAYPTTGELRRDLDVTPDNLTEETLAPIIEDTQPAPIPETISETNEEELIPLEDEIGSEELDSVLGLIELKNLDAMLAEMPAPDPDAEQPAVEESAVAEPTIATEGFDTSSWVPFSETEEEAAQNINFSQEIADEKTDTEFAPELADNTTEITPPPLPEEFRDQQVPELVPETTITDAADLGQIDAGSADFPITKETAARITEDATPASQNFPDFDFKMPWDTNSETQPETAESSTEAIEPAYESPVSTPEDEFQESEKSIDPKDLDFNAWLEEIAPPAPIESDEIEPLTQAEDVQSPSPVEADSIGPPAETAGTDNTFADLFSEYEPLIDSPEFSKVMQNDIVDESSVPLVIPTEYESEVQALEHDIEPVPVPSVVEPETQYQSVEESDGLMDLPPALPVESYNTNLSSEPGTSPLGIRNFRFHYSCLLIPRNPQQFLTRDLSERLSFLIPQLHLEYGWRLTGITIRPQYMLWSVSLPIDVCPIHIVRDIRRRTTAHITSNFTDLTPIGNGDDFWAPGFLILSGNTSPTIRMISDFISQTRMNQSFND